MAFGKILAKWRLRGAINDIVIARDYIKNNRYDTADLVLLDTMNKLEKISKHYSSQPILNKIGQLRQLLKQEKGRYSERTKSQMESIFESIMADSEKMLRKPPIGDLSPQYS